jgi:hypothetical protein
LINYSLIKNEHSSKEIIMKEKMPAKKTVAKKVAAPAKVKVSQATINDIKKMGMAEALKMVKMYASQGKAAGKAGADMRAEGSKFLKGELAEGVRRMYGDRRFAEATKTKKKAASSPDAARRSATK